MATLSSMGNKRGRVESNTYQVPAAFVGTTVQLALNIPANQNTSNRSITLRLEWADSRSGPWTKTHEGTWVGGGAGKDGSWGATYTYTVGSWLVGKWVRCVVDVPVRTRFGIEYSEIT